MKETLEVLAFVTDTNRSPIMMIEADSDKMRSIETTLWEMLGKHLNMITHKWGRRYGWGHFTRKEDKNVPPGVIKVDRLKGKLIRPHAKKVKITIEIEE